MNIRQPFPHNPALAPEIAPRKWTADELERMLSAGILTEDDNIELIGGDVVVMAPKGTRHEILRNELMTYWADRRPRDVKFAAKSPLRLGPYDEPEPDIILFPAEQRVTDVRGDTVLLVVEIADSSLSYDLKVKAPVYAAFGVREYWVIDVRTLTTTVHREPGPTGYGKIENIDMSSSLTPMLVPSLAVRLDLLDVD